MNSFSNIKSFSQLRTSKSQWKNKSSEIQSRRQRQRDKKIPIRKKLSPQDFLKSLLAGGFAGCIAKTTIAPFERVKILFQISQVSFSYRGVLEKLVNTVKTEGLHALWKGNTATILRVMPYAATQYQAFGIYSSLLAKDDYTVLTPLQRFLSGGASGATATLLTYPFDFLKTRMSIQPTENTYKHIGQAIVKIYRKEGVLVFYHGLSAALIGVLPYSGISWMVMDTSRQFFEDYINNGRRASPLQRLFCGAIAAICAQTFTYPLDIVRRRMQSAIMYKNKTPQYQTFSSTIKYILNNEGYKSFFKGVSMNWFKGPLSMGISYACFEILQRQFGVTKL